MVMCEKLKTGYGSDESVQHSHPLDNLPSSYVFVRGESGIKVCRESTVSGHNSLSRLLQPRNIQAEFEEVCRLTFIPSLSHFDHRSSYV